MRGLGGRQMVLHDVAFRPEGNKKASVNPAANGLQQQPWLFPEGVEYLRRNKESCSVF